MLIEVLNVLCSALTRRKIFLAQYHMPPFFHVLAQNLRIGNALHELGVTVCSRGVDVTPGLEYSLAVRVFCGRFLSILWFSIPVFYGREGETWVAWHDGVICSQVNLDNVTFPWPCISQSDYFSLSFLSFFLTFLCSH